MSASSSSNRACRTLVDDGGRHRARQRPRHLVGRQEEENPKTAPRDRILGRRIDSSQHAAVGHGSCHAQSPVPARRRPCRRFPTVYIVVLCVNINQQSMAARTAVHRGHPRGSAHAPCTCSTSDVSPGASETYTYKSVALFDIAPEKHAPQSPPTTRGQRPFRRQGRRNFAMQSCEERGGRQL